jgi:hypothetical protein
LDLVKHHQTEKAILVSETDDRNTKTVWLPLSQCQVEVTGGYTRRSKLEIVTVTMPQWLAEEKGLV